ncbi:MAG: glycoside hydrolase family 88 protein [Verrucomicrobia bacterium]|nr:glycoside hydrolase family 88 protein [Verrucomicrobiota bacterium]
MSQIEYRDASPTARPSRLFPEKQRVPFGWEAAPVDAGPKPAPLVFTWPKRKYAYEGARFRFAIALDDRETRRVQVGLHRSECSVGSVEVRVPPALQLFEFDLDAGNAVAVYVDNLELRSFGPEGALWVLVNSASELPIEPLLRPHLMLDRGADPAAEFFERLASLACVQPFGGMEGCVLDGLLDLAKLPQHARLAETARLHLGLFFKPDGRLICENAQSEPADNSIYGLEATLPFAALAQVDAQHKSIALALDFWKAHRDAEGAVIEGGDTTAEGSYTVAYPMAVIGKVRNSEALVREALQQLRVRTQRLVGEGEFHRVRSADGKSTERNWARGIAWHLLGTARTLATLEGLTDTAGVKKDFAKFAAWVQAKQLESGLWSVFVDEPKLLPDTSGSAGIAAALALGAKHGWLPAPARASAQRTLAALKKNLTPDGFVTGSSQVNRGGEALQRGNYRVILQFANGLMAQLIAALEA